jgi:HD-GYP domain-containing protein (c-di-GMP phosphodiesterase class II)
MRIAEVIGLGPDERSDLFYALLLKDLGCSSNAARLCQLFGADDLTLKRAHKLTDWTDPVASARYAYAHAVPDKGAVAKAWHVAMLGKKEKGSGTEMTRTRCERGAEIAHELGLSAATAGAIRTLDEHWNGLGMPAGLTGSQIPLLGRICSLAQTLEVFAHSHGADAAYGMARERRGTWFDPMLVDAIEEFEGDSAFWGTLSSVEQLEHVSDLEPEDMVIMADEARLDRVCRAFARVIDAKTPYTAEHSEGVARIAVEIGTEMHVPFDGLVTLRRAGLLHDIGKLGVSNLILDKPAKLTELEMAEMRKHPRHTEEILMRVERFRGFAGIASAHHERLDGTGYHQGVKGDQLDQLSRILAVADIAEALTAARPYRSGLPQDKVLEIMGRLAGSAIDPGAFEALKARFRAQ